MATLSLTFPEKDQPTVIALTGARLTIGRLPFNTIQIIDRTVSGFHAELINEHGHYRLHDRGSSNGTFVNGQKIADYHLTENCTITFGTVEAHFNSQAVEAEAEAESFPTRSEINSVRQENVELKATVEALREEASALRQARPMEGGDAALVVTKEEFDKVVVEREELKEARVKQDEAIARLKADLAVLQRDRVNLQLAYDGVQRELEGLRRKSGEGESASLAPKAAAAVLAAQDASEKDEVRIEVPMLEKKTTELIAVEPKPVVEAAPVVEPPAEPEPAAPAAPFVAPAAPAGPAEPKPYFTQVPRPGTGSVTPLPKAPGASPSVRPLAPLPRASAGVPVATARPTTGVPTSGVTPPVAAKAPIGLGSGIRPLAKPPIAATGTPKAEGGPNAGLPNAPTARLAPRPLPTGKLPSQPTVRAVAAPQPKVGPKGTQKIVDGGQA